MLMNLTKAREWAVGVWARGIVKYVLF